MKKLWLHLGLCICLASCSYLHPYHMDIQQGRVILPSQINQLKHGMTQKQVVQLIGKPLLKDPFHHHRWTYVYYHRPTEGQTQLKRLILYFKKGRINRIESDYEHSLS